MSSTMKKPGYMLRACIAWVILNLVLLFTLAALVYILGPYLQVWYVMIPIIVAVVASEWVIMAETIAPIISDWIKQEESVETGKEPSWKNK
jgi:hypothetical protein